MTLRRNEAVELFGLMTLWAILNYLESGEPKYLYWLTTATVLHFTAKETSYIYTAQALLFLALYFIYKATAKEWKIPKHRLRFLVALIIGILLLTLLFFTFSRYYQPSICRADSTQHPNSFSRYWSSLRIRNFTLSYCIVLFYKRFRTSSHSKRAFIRSFGCNWYIGFTPPFPILDQYGGLACAS
jgi:hypothetical protein